MGKRLRLRKSITLSGIVSTIIIVIIILMVGDIKDVIRIFTGVDQLMKNELNGDRVIKKNKGDKNTSEETLHPIEYEKIVVDRVVDGDTFVYYVNGNSTRLRLIGVNTPESVKEKRYEFYGKEASDYTHKKLEGKTVYLEKDKESRDQYGRELRYVWLNEPYEENFEKDCFNGMLIRNGYAKAVVYGENDKYYNRFVAFEEQAREEKIGMWQK